MIGVAERKTTRTLLLCGILSTLLYVAIDVTGALSWPGYSYSSQVISEMSAVDAPTRNLLAPLYVGYSLLVIAFAAGVVASAGRERGLRIAGYLLAAVGVVGLLFTFFPMHMRGHEPGFTDTMHIALSGVNVLFLLLAIGIAAGAFGNRFRLYSTATILVMLAFGAWTGRLAPGIPEGLPTPMLGIVERIVFAAFLLWITVLAIALLRPGGRRTPNSGRSARRGSVEGAEIRIGEHRPRRPPREQQLVGGAGG